MGDIIVSTFDYALIDEDARDDVRDAAVRIKVRMARAAADIIDIGQDLIAVKGALGHGHFLNWIDAEFDMSADTAGRFMNVAQRLAGQIPHCAEFNASALYTLAAPSTPDVIVAEVIERAGQGETFTAADIKAMKEEWSSEKKDLKAKAARADSIKDDFQQQLTDLQAKLAATRDEADTLKHELARQSSASVPPPAAPHDPFDAFNKWTADMNRVWGRAPADWRALWLEQIDAPVFDSTHAGARG